MGDRPHPIFPNRSTPTTTAIVPNLSLTTKNLSGRLTVAKNLKNYTFDLGALLCETAKPNVLHRYRSNTGVFRLSTPQQPCYDSRLTAEMSRRR